MFSNRGSLIIGVLTSTFSVASFLRHVIVDDPTHAKPVPCHFDFWGTPDNSIGGLFGALLWPLLVVGFNVAAPFAAKTAASGTVPETMLFAAAGVAALQYFAFEIAMGRETKAPTPLIHGFIIGAVGLSCWPYVQRVIANMGKKVKK